MLLLISPKGFEGGEFNAPSGMNWEMEPHAVSPEVAAAASREVLEVLIDFKETGLKYLPRVPVVREGAQSVVSLQPPENQPANTKRLMPFWCQVKANSELDGVSNHPEIANRMPHLLQLFDDSNTKLGGDRHGFIVNVYDSGGVFPEHRDVVPLPTRSINLQGVRRLDIIDPQTNKKFAFALTPGEGFTLENPNEYEQRPKHKLTNETDEVSLGFVV